MEAAPSSSNPWSTTQAYILGVCCLLLGVTAGYALRGIRPASANATPPAPAAMPHGNQQPTPEQMKHMAEKHVEPLLAQLQSKPNDTELLGQIAESYFAAHQFNSAASYYERAAAVKPSSKLWVSIGNSYYYAGDPNKALTAFQKAVQLEPGSADALFNIGILKWQVQNDPQGAVDAWQRLLKANPKHPRRLEVEQMVARAKQHIGQATAPSAPKPTS